MSRFIPGDYVRPISPSTGLPRGSVWVVRRYQNEAIGAVELYAISPTARGSYPRSHVIGRVFADHNFEKVVMVDGQWRAANTPRTVMLDQFALDELRFVGSVTDDDDSSNPNTESIPAADLVQVADKLVERAAATLDAAKENARKAREEARAAAKAEAKRKAAAEAAKKAREEREAVAIRLHKDRDLAAATSALIAELSRLHNGGAEQDAPAIVAMHAEQLQPLAKSYGYKIAKPGVIAIVIKA